MEKMDHAARVILLESVIAKQLAEISVIVAKSPKGADMHHYACGRQAALLDLQLVIDSTKEDKRVSNEQEQRTPSVPWRV